MPRRRHQSPTVPALPRRFPGVVLTAAVLALFAAAGCDDEPGVFPADQTGVIHVRVHDGDASGLDYLVVTAESPSGVYPRVRVRANLEEDGSFWLTVPEGVVTVRLENANGHTLYWRAGSPTPYVWQAETLVVAGGVREIEFACGRLSAQVAVPPALANGYWESTLVLADDLARSVARMTHANTDQLEVAFRMVPPGRYFLRIESPQDIAVFVPATFDTAAAEVLTVRAGEETRHESAIAACAVLSGTVTGSWQVLGFDNPTVSVFYGTVSVGGQTTDAEGAFSVPLLAGGSFRLRVTIGNVTRWIGGDDLDSATVFTVAPGQELTGIAHVESGLVCTFDPAGPIPSQVYDVVLRSATSLIYDSSRWVDEIKLANLAPGEVFLSVNDWGMSDVWFPQYWDRRDRLEDADAIVVPADGGVVQVTMTLVRGARILGRLLDVTGQPLSTADMFLMVYAASDSSTRVNLYTDWDFGNALYDGSTGDYVLTQLRDGQFKMRARAGGTAWTWWPGRAGWDSAGVVIIEDGADLTELDWRLLH